MAASERREAMASTMAKRSHIESGIINNQAAIASKSRGNVVNIIGVMAARCGGDIEMIIIAKTAIKAAAA